MKPINKKNKLEKNTIEKKKPTLTTKPISHGTGRRKSSVARVWLRRGNGHIIVNTKSFSKYFQTDVAKMLVIEPLAEIKANDQFDIHINVHGGGIHSQAGASRLGISRALALYNEEYKLLLRAGNFLTVDSRNKERKKYGQKGARRKFQFVKR